MNTKTYNDLAQIAKLGIRENEIIANHLSKDVSTYEQLFKTAYHVGCIVGLFNGLRDPNASGEIVLPEYKQAIFTISK